jgi:hypothetical protein
VDGVGAVDRLTTDRLAAVAGFRLLTAAAAAVAAALAVPLAAAGAAAQSSEVDLVTVSGVDLAEPLIVRATERPQACAALYGEVDWLVGRDGDAAEPEPDTLGPQYALVVHVEGEARHRFNLFPLAEGGPRAFRPVEQPGDRTAEEGWFYGRLSMPETLRSVGAPLTGDPATGGGTGGGQPPTSDQSSPPDSNLLGFLDEWRNGMLLTVLVTVAVVAGLAGVAYLIRRTV